MRTANAMDVFVDAFVCYPFPDIVAEYECEEKVETSTRSPCNQAH